MMLYMKPKDFRTSNSGVLGTHSVNDDGEHIIELPYHASTRTKLHELGHTYHDHRHDKPITFEELFGREVDAETYAYHHMDKALDYRVLLPAIFCIANYRALTTGCLFQLCLDKLAALKITLDMWNKSELWDIVKEQNK